MNGTPPDEPIVAHVEPCPFMQCPMCLRYFALRFDHVDKVLPRSSGGARPKRVVYFRCKYCKAVVEYLDMSWPYIWF